jgi:hypothetical protein
MEIRAFMQEDERGRWHASASPSAAGTLELAASGATKERCLAALARAVRQ